MSGITNALIGAGIGFGLGYLLGNKTETPPKAVSGFYGFGSVSSSSESLPPPLPTTPPPLPTTTKEMMPPPPDPRFVMINGTQYVQMSHPNYNAVAKQIIANAKKQGINVQVTLPYSMPMPNPQMQFATTSTGPATGMPSMPKSM